MVVVVGEQSGGIPGADPADLVDLLVRGERGVGAADLLGHPVADLLVARRGVIVHAAQRMAQAYLEPGFLGDLSDRCLLQALAGIGLAFGEGPVVVGRTVDHQQLDRYPASISWVAAVSYTHLRAHETDSYLVCRLLLEKK